MAIFFDNDNGNIIVGSADFDLISGNGGADTVFASGGDDFIEGGAGADVLDGGAGIDTAIYINGATAVTVNLATGQESGGDTLTSIENVRGSNLSDVLIGNDVANKLEGRNSEDSLSGAGGNDTLDGGAQNDTLQGGSGADVLQGGDGFDIATYSEFLAGVNVSVLYGTGMFGDASNDKLTSIENLEGSNFDDILEGDAALNRLYGLEGSDFLRGLGGNDQLTAGGGDDLLRGGSGADWLDGGAGIDTASYEGSWTGVVADLKSGNGFGADAGGDELRDIENVSGTDFADVFFGDAAANELSGLAGNDLLNGAAGADTLSGGFGNDILEGGAGADVLIGGAGTDTAKYQSSNAGVSVNLTSGATSGAHAAGDSLAGIENLTGSEFADTLIGNGEINSLIGMGGGDTIRAGSGNDTVYGGAGADSINGGDSADYLYGDAGADTLNGGNGTDVLTGGAERDVLAGGDGADRFDFNAVIESGTTGATRDAVNGFAHLADLIDVETIDAMAGLAGNNAFSFIGANAFAGEGQIRAVQTGADTIVSFNTDGANGAEMTIALPNFTASSLTAADFIL